MKKKDTVTAEESKYSYQSLLENTIKKIHYNSYNEWVQNFALNLHDIWKEPSAKQLDPTNNFSHVNENRSAIVIGRGPSLKKHKHLELLAQSNYNGSIVCTDGVLINALNNGVTPEKFKNFYVVTIHPYSDIEKYYDNPIVDKFGSKIKGIFSTIVAPTTVRRARQAGIKIHWIHSLFDYEEGKKSFNQISALMVRAKNQTNGLPAIQTGGNVGTSAWFVSWQILKCSTIALIGINHGWEEEDTKQMLLAHGGKGEIKNTDSSYQKLFKKIYNPEFKCYCILDPLFQFYSTALKEFISRSPSWLTTINATEGGSIFGERIQCMIFENFLKIYNS